jgi:hypothetical protein
MSTPVPEHTHPPTATPLPANTSPTLALPVADTPSVQRSVRLITPSDGASGKGKIEFHWQAPFTLLPKQAFEPIFWRDGQDPMVSGLGWGGTTQSTSFAIDLDIAAPDNYLWGILLVETNPYKRVQFLGGGWRFIVQGENSSTLTPRMTLSPTIPKLLLTSTPKPTITLNVELAATSTPWPTFTSTPKILPTSTSKP